MRTFLALLLFGALLCASGAEDPHRNYAESQTISRFGIVATSQTLASNVGAAILDGSYNGLPALQ